MSNQKLNILLTYLINHEECEWIEFKHNFYSSKKNGDPFTEIGKQLSALSNSACLQRKECGYLVFGIKDDSRDIVGTTFNANSTKKGNENLTHWLATRCSPRIDFIVNEFDIDGKHIVIYSIPATKGQPVKFLNSAYIRVGSITRYLLDFPEKEANIWREPQKPFESELAKNNISESDVITLLSTQTYFDLQKLPYPPSQKRVIEKFLSEKLITKEKNRYNITKLGAILFARNLQDFDLIQRKAVRVIVYKGKNKVETEREQIGTKGYAIGFEGLVDWINSQLPANEEIGKVLRKDTRMYPEIAIREVVGNALIHQNLLEKGGPMVEIFSDRIEISNPGLPLVNPERFIDEYVSRNENLADLMRRLGFCEERGSGIDKVILYNEIYQLPAINVLRTGTRTKVILYSYQNLNSTDKKDKIRACYQHACLKYVSNEKMTNQSLRNRFDIDKQNSAIASRIIKDTIESGKIKEDDPDSNSRKYACYVPFWV